MAATRLDAAFVVAFISIVSAPALAEMTATTVLSTKEAGPFRGKPYQEIVVRMDGRAPGGDYSVPLTLLSPKLATDAAGVAVVDVLNTVAVGKDTVLGPEPLPLARRHIGDDFLFGTGHAYVGVLWDKDAVESLGAGHIATPADGYTVLADAGRLARRPSAYLPIPAVSRTESLKVIAFGFSQTGALLRSFYMEHHNTQDGVSVFDAAIIGGAGGGCFRLESRRFEGCEGPPVDGGKVIAVLAEGDAQFAGGWERGESPDYRFVEVAGVPHIPASVDDFRGRGLPKQNPVGFEPVMRAALANLEMWLDGKEPPPSIGLALRDTQPRDFYGIEVTPLAVDADGNAEGGLRLPHMATILPDGTHAGAPVGAYSGLAWGLGEHGFFLGLGGEFTPFPPEKLRALYPDHATYVGLVAAAAGDLVAQRYILPEDGRAYVESARRSTVGSLRRGR